MIKAELKIQNSLGLHARPAALFVQEASKFVSDIMVSKDDVEVNGKSVMGMMMLAAECGSSLKIMIKGKDEAQALAALKQLFDNKFNED
ncbi:MAG TPA: HPr family phosphocarrier protein [Elusimicrobiales bacterium]|nr:HPr family phosphocarrier protein [Elusimicrobiales bacterium]